MKILLVDCDGTIRQPKSRAKFINKPTDQEPMPGAVEALNHHHNESWLIVGITNQAGVAAGHKSLENCMKEQQYTLKLFPQLKGIYFCPDYEGDICYFVDKNEYRQCPKWLPNINFRKPSCGMLLKALIDFNGDKQTAWMIGDCAERSGLKPNRTEDEQAANAAGINFMWADIWRERWRTGEYRV